jgi:hypothetical protein
MNGIRKENTEKNIWPNTEGRWRVETQTNEELENAIRYENIVRHIKSKMLSWLGHVERMPNKGWLRPYINGNRMQQDRKEGQD